VCLFKILELITMNNNPDNIVYILTKKILLNGFSSHHESFIVSDNEEEDGCFVFKINEFSGPPINVTVVTLTAPGFPHNAGRTPQQVSRDSLRCPWLVPILTFRYPTRFPLRNPILDYLRTPILDYLRTPILNYQMTPILDYRMTPILDYLRIPILGFLSTPPKY